MSASYATCCFRLLLQDGPLANIVAWIDREEHGGTQSMAPACTPPWSQLPWPGTSAWVASIQTWSFLPAECKQQQAAPQHPAASRSMGAGLASRYGFDKDRACLAPCHCETTWSNSALRCTVQQIGQQHILCFWCTVWRKFSFADGAHVLKRALGVAEK